MHAPDVDVSVVDGRAQECLAASDAVLVASGTATLEATLVKRPMVVAYRVAPLTNWILRGFGLVKSDVFLAAEPAGGAGPGAGVLPGAGTAGGTGSLPCCSSSNGLTCGSLPTHSARYDVALRREASARAADAVLRSRRGSTNADMQRASSTRSGADLTGAGPG